MGLSGPMSNKMLMGRGEGVKSVDRSKDDATASADADYLNRFAVYRLPISKPIHVFSPTQETATWPRSQSIKLIRRPTKAAAESVTQMAI